MNRRELRLIFEKILTGHYEIGESFQATVKLLQGVSLDEHEAESIRRTANSFIETLEELNFLRSREIPGALSLSEEPGRLSFADKKECENPIEWEVLEWMRNAREEIASCEDVDT